MPDPHWCGFLIDDQRRSVDAPAHAALTALHASASNDAVPAITLELLRRPKLAWVHFDAPTDEHKQAQLDAYPKRLAGELARALKKRVWFVGFSDFWEVAAAYDARGKRRWSQLAVSDGPLFEALADAEEAGGQAEAARLRAKTPFGQLERDAGLDVRAVFPYGCFGAVPAAARSGRRPLRGPPAARAQKAAPSKRDLWLRSWSRDQQARPAKLAVELSPAELDWNHLLDVAFAAKTTPSDLLEQAWRASSARLRSIRRGEDLPGSRFANPSAFEVRLGAGTVRQVRAEAARIGAEPGQVLFAAWLFAAEEIAPDRPAPSKPAADHLDADRLELERWRKTYRPELFEGTRSRELYEVPTDAFTRLERAAMRAGVSAEAWVEREWAARRKAVSRMPLPPADDEAERHELYLLKDVHKQLRRSGQLLTNLISVAAPR